MTCNLDIIARMALNGYVIIPAVPGQKQTYYKWGSVTKENYNFSETFKGQPVNCNAAILCGEDIAVVDLDAHGSEPNGRTIFDMLDPSVYEGCIVELSQSGGAHIYYKGISKSNRLCCWLPGFESYDNMIEPFKMRVEAMPAILSGRTLCYCNPTVTPKGEYRIISRENMLNTKPHELPELHQIWQLVNPYQQIIEKERRTFEPLNVDLTQKQIEYSIEGAKESRYNVKKGWRHYEAIAFAGEILSLGISEHEAERHVTEYIERLRTEGLAYPGEARDIVKWASRKTKSEPIVRFKHIRKCERKESTKKILAALKGASS